jgi:hypothetical protein
MGRTIKNNKDNAVNNMNPIFSVDWGYEDIKKW